MTIDGSDIKILSASVLAGKAKTGFFLSFFSEDFAENVQFCIESLVRRKLLRWEKDCLLPTDEGLKYCSLSGLFGHEKVPSNTKHLECVTGLTVCAMINLLISGKPCKPAVFPHIYPEGLKDIYALVKDLALSSGALFLSSERYLPDIEIVNKLSQLTNADLALTLIRTHYSEEAGTATKAFIKTLSSCPTTENSMLGMLSFYLLLHNATNNAKEIATLLLNLNTIEKNNDICFVNPNANRVPKNKDAKLECDTDLSIRLDHDSAMPPLLWLYADIVKTDVVCEWLLSKDGLFRALDAGVSLDRIKEELSYPYYNQLLELWQVNYNRIKVYDNCIVRCSDDLITVMENHKPLKEHILSNISYGVYYMKRSTAKIWQDILCSICSFDRLPLALDLTSKPNPQLIIKTGNKFDITEDKQEKNIQISNSRTLELTTDRLIQYFNLGSTISAPAMDYGAKHSIVNQAIKSKKTYLLIETLENKFVAKPFEAIKTEDKGMIIKLLILPVRKEVLLPLSSFYRVTSLEAFSSH